MRIKKILLTAFIASSFTMGVLAQGGMTFQAYPDNAFIEPDANYFKSIDVLANDHYFFDRPNDCDRDGIEITVLTNGTIGYAQVTGDNQIEYRPFPGKSGPDKIEYQIECFDSGETSTAIIYINVNDQPNVISDKDCYVDPIGIDFEIKELARTSPSVAWVHTQGSPICGDIDNDGNIEIITYKPKVGPLRQWEGAQIWKVIKNETTGKIDINLQQEIPVSNPDLHNCFGNFAIAKVDGNKYASLFIVATSEQTLAKYDLSETTGKYEQTWIKTYAYPTPGRFSKVASPLVVDLMGNGRTQVSILSKVFDTKTGNLLVEGTNDAGLPMIPATADPHQKPLFSFGHFGCSDVTLYQSVLIPADVDGDGKLELIGGDCVYKVHLDDFDTKTATNTFKLFIRANKTGHPEIGDGGTAVADFDGDGLIDIIVTGPKSNGYRTSSTAMAYIYNPRTGAVLHTNIIDNIPRTVVHGPSQPFVGDLDGDGHPEFSLTGYKTLVAYKLDPVSKTLSLMWDLPTTDASASTTLSMFDFAQDGKAKLIYRDQETLRIIDGRKYDENGAIITIANRALATFDGVLSGTINEYPIVADIDGDGHAEIITVGSDILPTLEGDKMGTIRIFGAAGTQKWAPARNMWNQTAYNPVYINDDLTIPAKPISPATAFVSPDGRLDRPFNNFLQQATNLNKEGLMIMLGPDLLFDSRVPKRITIDDNANTLHVSVGIMNQGDAAFTGPIKLQMYAYTQHDNKYRKIGAPFLDANTTGLGYKSTENTRELSYTIPNKNAELALGYDNLFMTINLNTDPSEVPEFHGSAECHDGINNFTSGFSLVSGSRVICEGDTETITVTPKATYDIKWYTAAKGGIPIKTGDSYAVTKNADIIQYLFVEAYRPGGSTPITHIRDTIFIYKTPDSLVWNGNAANQNWHDFKNWKNPIANYPEVANIPRKCTNILLPTAISNYPDLSPINTSIATDYTTYVNSECNNIHYAFGSETVRPDKLVYAKAYVDLTFSSHRWQMFAPPLKDFYTGDIYRKNIIPFHDDVKAYTKFWSRRNPSNNYYTSGWTQLFHKPDLSFEAGQGLGVWISDKAIEGQVSPPRDPFDFSFPKHDPQYRVYLVDTDIPDPALSPYVTDRANSHRFIFDGNTQGVDFNLKIDGEIKTVGQMVLVGNPFMAHLDFDKFYATNSAYIQNYYSVLDENATMQYYNKGTSTLGKNIAPMQAFLVEIKAPFTNLKANGLMTLSAPGNKIKNVEDSSSDEFQLKITANQAKHANQAFIQFNNNADNDYKAGEDIAGLFPTKASSDSRAVSIYSLTDNGTKVAVNKLNTNGLKDKQIPLGIWSTKNEPITINISNLDKVPSEYSLYLYDKLLAKSQELSANSMMTFDAIKTDKNSFVDDRFFLQFKLNAGSSIEEQDEEQNISAFVRNSSLHLITSENIKEIEVYNLQGQLLYATKLNTNSAQCKLPYADIYIVKIKNDKQIFLKKLINQ